MILRAYRYLYYRIYAWNRKHWGEQDGPEFNAILGVSMLSFLNIGTAVTIAQGISGIDIFESLNQSKAGLVLAAVAILLIHYFLLYYKSEPEDVLSEFPSKEELRKKGRIWTNVYIIGTVVVFLGSWFTVYFLDIFKP